jgi:hypothetical protein
MDPLLEEPAYFGAFGGILPGSGLMAMAVVSWWKKRYEPVFRKERCPGPCEASDEESKIAFRHLNNGYLIPWQQNLTQRGG